MDERRRFKQQRVLKAGTIEIGGGGAIDCTVRTFFRHGAALDVPSSFGIPNEFILTIPK
jgi:hypothetical protein